MILKSFEECLLPCRTNSMEKESFNAKSTRRSACHKQRPLIKKKNESEHYLRASHSRRTSVCPVLGHHRINNKLECKSDIESLNAVCSIGTPSQSRTISKKEEVVLYFDKYDILISPQFSRL